MEDCCELLENLFELRELRSPQQGFIHLFFMYVRFSRSYETEVDVGFFGISTDLQTRCICRVRDVVRTEYQRHRKVGWTRPGMYGILAVKDVVAGVFIVADGET